MRGFVLVAVGWAFANAPGFMFALMHDAWYMRLCGVIGAVLFSIGCLSISEEP